MKEEFWVKPAGKVRENDWTSFVRSHPDGNIFQTMEMVEVYSGTERYEPMALAAIDASGNIQALMNAVLMHEREGPLGSFTSRAVVQVGPLFSHSEAGHAAALTLLDTYERLAAKKALFTQVRMIHQMPQLRELLVSRGYRMERHLTYFLDLDENVDNAWRKLHKSRRKGINRAKKNGLVIRELQGRKYIPQLYGFMDETYRNAGVPLVDVSVFNRVMEILVPRSMARFSGCFHGDEFIGGRISLLFKDRLYDWYAGVSGDKLSLYPNDLLVWHIIEWGCRNRYRLFDFMGAGRPGERYGPGEFKRRFGGRLEDYDRYELVHQPLKLGLSRKAYKLYKRMRVKKEG